MTRRSEELASRRPRTVPRIRSMAEDKATVQPPTFRVHSVGIIRCGLAMRAAKTLPPRSRRRRIATCRCRTCRGIRSHARECRVRCPSGDIARCRPDHVARTELAEKRKLRPVALARPRLLRADPPCQQARDAAVGSTGLDVSRLSALGPCLRRARSWRYECVAGTP